MVSAIKLLEEHHSAPRYREGMYNKGWNKQQQMQWGPWSPQWPKPKANKKKEDKGKDKPQNVLSSYESFATSSAPSSSSAGGTQDSLLFKEFVNYMKENKDELPENIQKLIPDDGKDNIRQAQRKLNKQRNILNKISNKQKALQQDQERWEAWLVSVKEEIQQQRTKHEESQARLSKELLELQEEEKKMNQTDSEVMDLEEDAEKGVEEILDELLEGKGNAKECQKLQEYQAHLEMKYQAQLDSERQRMQQIFSDQFRQLAAATMDPYMEGLGMQNIIAESAINVEELDEEQQKEEEAPKPPGLVRNAVAPFGVQRAVKTQNVSSPYSAKEKELKKLAEKEKEKAKMASLMKPPDTGQ